VNPIAKHVLWIKLGVYICLLSTLAACRELSTAAPLPTPDTVLVQITPALQKLTPRLQACAQQDTTVGLRVKEVPAQALDFRQAAVSLRIDLAPGTQPYAADLGSIQIAIIAPPGQAPSHLSRNDLANIYNGRLTQWPGSSQPIQLWTYLPGDDLRQAFERLVPGEQSEQPPSQQLRLAPSPQAMLDAVAASPGALGYVPKDWLDARVQAIPLDVTLAAPLLALTPAEPQGAARRLIACLQK
jgi:hypothetical protein